jgi:antitoxin CcdA
LGINPSETLEAALSDEIRQRQRDLWRKENRESIEAYNELVARDGVFSKGLRGF